MAYGAHSDTLRRSLAAVTAGDTIRIRRIHTAQLRSDCAAIGLGEGDVLTCRSSAARQLQLQAARGPSILLPLDWARWIEVEQTRD